MANIHYLDPGDKDGKPVLLLHGLGVDGSSWTLQFPSMISSGFRPIAVDVPGFGNSKYGNKKWSIERVSMDLAEFMQEIRIFPAYVVGLSMGGTIAQAITLNYPDLVSKLVLANTFSVLRPKTLKGWMYFLQRFVLVQTLGLPVQAEFVAKRIFPNQDQEIIRQEMISQICNADPRAYRAAMRSLGMFNSKKRLHEIKVPTLVITGAKDTTVHPTHQTQMTEWIPGARQVIMKEAGHAASVEFPDQFNELLINFLCE